MSGATSGQLSTPSIGEPPIRRGCRRVRLRIAHAQDVDEPTLTQVRQRTPHEIRRLSQVRDDLFEAERFVLRKQFEDRPLHPCQSLPLSTERV